MRRRVQKCINCGDDREIVAHGLCSMCYQADWRERRSEFVLPNASQRGYVAERNKDHALLVGIVKLVDQVKCLSDQDRLGVKTIIQPHLLDHVMALTPAGLTPDEVEDGDIQSTVNGPNGVNINPSPGSATVREPADDADDEFTVNDETEINNYSGPPTPEELEGT